MNRYPLFRRPIVVRPTKARIPGLGYRLLVGLSLEMMCLRLIHPTRMLK